MAARPLSDQLREVLGAGVYDSEEFAPYPTGDDIVLVRFRTGCAELVVTYRDSDGGVESAVIDAAPVLSVLVNGLLTGVDKA